MRGNGLGLHLNDLIRWSIYGLVILIFLVQVLNDCCAEDVKGGLHSRDKALSAI